MKCNPAPKSIKKMQVFLLHIYRLISRLYDDEEKEDDHDMVMKLS